MNEIKIFFIVFYALLGLFVFLFALPSYIGRCEELNKRVKQETAEAFKEWLTFGYVPLLRYQQSRNAVARKIRAHRQRTRIKKQLKEATQ